MWPWSKIRERRFWSETNVLKRRVAFLEEESSKSFEREKGLRLTIIQLERQLKAKEALLQTAVLRDPKNGRLLSKRKAATN